MSDFDEFLNEDLPPPTDIDVKWARENFSSRVLPPLIEDDGGEPGGESGGGPGGESGSLGFSVVGDPVENQVLEHGLVTTDNTHIATGSVLLASKYGVYRIVVGSTNFSEKQIRNFSSTTPTVDTGEGIIEFLSCTVTQETDSGVMQKCTVDYQYTLKAAIKNDTVVPTGLDSVEDGAYFDRTQVKLYDYKFNQASGLIVVKIVDDVPTAVDEAIVWVTEDGESVVSGDVTLNDLAGADTPLVFVQWDPANAAVIAQLSVYGVLVLNNDGTWMYTLDNTRPATQALTEDDHLTFSLQYQIRDNDGDISQSVLNIGIDGSYDGPPLPCVARRVASYSSSESNPGVLWASLYALTTNMDPALYHILHINDSTAFGRTLPINRDAATARTIGSGVPWYVDEPTEGQGIFMVVRTHQAGQKFIDILMSAAGETHSADYVVNLTPGSRVLIGPGTHLFDTLTPPEGEVPVIRPPSDAVILPGNVFPIDFIIPTGVEVTHVFWMKAGRSVVSFDPLDVVKVEDGWADTHYNTIEMEYSYACYSSTGAMLYHQEFAGKVAVTLGTSGHTIKPTYQHLFADNRDPYNRKIHYVTERGYRGNGYILGYSNVAPPVGIMPTIVSWPLSIGKTVDCYGDYSVRYTGYYTNLLCEATLNYGGNGGTLGAGYNIKIDNVGGLVTLRFYASQYWSNPANGLDIAAQKQVFLCRSSNMTTTGGGAAFASPHDTHDELRAPIPDSIGLLTKTPIYAGDIAVFGSGRNAQRGMPIDESFFGSAPEVFGDSTPYPYIQLTLTRVS